MQAIFHRIIPRNFTVILEAEDRRQVNIDMAVGYTRLNWWHSETLIEAGQKLPQYSVGISYI
jgi:hypothetical protein